MDEDDDKLEKILSDNRSSSSGLHLDGAQGDDEQQTEPYKKYGEGAAEQPTQRSDKSGSGVTGSASEQAATVQHTDIEEAIQFAKKYLEDLLSFFGLNTDVYATTEDHQVIELDVPSTHLNGFLIGQRGDTVRALQYMISSALKNKSYSHTRVNVDVADYKKQRNERLVKKAEEWFKQVKDSGKPMDLQPMNPAERRVIHQAATDYGLTTESVGEGRERHIVLKPAEGSETTDQKAEEVSSLQEKE